MDPSHDGQLQVIIGPMFSGKTSELIRRIQRFFLASYRCLIVKSRSEGEKTVESSTGQSSRTSVMSHDGHSLPAIHVQRLAEIQGAIADNFDVIGIDDGHLFSDLVEFCREESDRGKIVMVAGLDSFQETVFSSVLNIIPLAESVTKLTSICMACSEEAQFTKSLQESQHGLKYIFNCLTGARRKEVYLDLRELFRQTSTELDQSFQELHLGDCELRETDHWGMSVGMMPPAVCQLA